MKNSLSAMTAIAAVLAFATPAMAQDVPPAPVTTAPDPVSVTPPVADTAPPTPAPTATAPVDPLGATVADDPAPAPAAAPPAAAPRAARTRATTAAPAPVRATRIAPRAPVAVAPTPTSPAPVETIAPLGAPIVAATPPAALPAPVEAPEAQSESASVDVLPIAAAGGLGLLALLGAGAALRRRRRREEEAEYEALDEAQFEQPAIPVAYAEPVREPTVKRPPFTPRAPAMAAAVATTGKPIDAPTNTLPDGFDLSRFGPHVQAAYRGPTEDNPSLSLKNRLRRGSAMDQMARNDGETAPPVARQAPASPTRDAGAVVSKMRPAPSSSASFILGGGATRPKPSPVTQH